MPSSTSGHAEGGEVNEPEGLHAAAESILSAIEAKDAAALTEGLHAFWEICESEEGPEEE